MLSYHPEKEMRTLFWCFISYKLCHLLDVLETAASEVHWHLCFFYHLRHQILFCFFCCCNFQPRNKVTDWFSQQLLQVSFASPLTSLVHFNLCLFKANKSVYDAAVFCLEHAGRLAEKVEEALQTSRHCATIEGSLLLCRIPNTLPEGDFWSQLGNLFRQHASQQPRT